MAYICKNCGVVNENKDSICNPIGDMYKTKSCAIPSVTVCHEKEPEMKYSCECGNVSADPQHLCKPQKP